MARQLFVDLDGVLADFDTNYTSIAGVPPNRDDPDEVWLPIVSTPNFFRYMPPMPGYQTLWNWVRPFNPTILSGVPRFVPKASFDKVKWVRNFLGASIPVITCPSADKYKYGQAGDILIDDYVKYREAWQNMGGIWITHESADESIKRLAKVLML